MAEILVRGHNCINSLSSNETVIFNAWLLREVFHMQNIMQLHRSGLLDRVDYQTWLAFTAAQLKTPGGNESWNRQKISITPTIVEVIEIYMKENSQAPSLIQLYPEVYGEDSHLASKDESIA